MEQFDYLKRFGDCVKASRKELKKTQIEFYRFLYPDVDNSDENIKKQMNKIEHGKMKTLNTEFVIRFCDKCEVSADYLFGLNTEYKNHEIEFVSNYTGLEPNAVEQLHRWNNDQKNGADLSKIEDAFLEYEEQEHINMFKKQHAISLLRIVNYLFKSGYRKSKHKKGRKELYSNCSILYSLYLLCMSKPCRVNASVIPDDSTKYILERYPNLNINLDHVEVNLNKPMVLVDSNKIHYLLDPKETLERIGKDQLNDGINWLIEQVKSDEASESANL